jgi:hypothetical protein
MNLPAGEDPGFAQFLGGPPTGPASNGGGPKLPAGMGDILRPGLELAQTIISQILEEMGAGAMAAPPLPPPAPPAENQPMPGPAKGGMGAGMGKAMPMGGKLPSPPKTPGY